jgi:hypothetical protein
MPGKNWITFAYKVAFIAILLVVFLGVPEAVGQMVVKENPAVNQTTNKYNSTFNPTSQFYSNPKFSQNNNETGNVCITKVVFSNVSLPSADEYVALYNAGSDMDLYNWAITVGNTATYTLPGFILDSLSSVNAHFGKGATNSTDVYLNQAPNALNDKHGDIRLSDGVGNLLSEMKY